MLVACSCPVAYITVDFKKVVSELFHAGSTLEESDTLAEFLEFLLLFS